MYMNIRPRQKKDKGGWLCMPQCKNIPEGKKRLDKDKMPNLRRIVLEKTFAG